MSIQLSTRVMHVKDQTTGSYDTVDILKGSGIDDVQINGTSIVEEGVANVSIASTAALGVLKPRYGLKINANGELDIDKASNNFIRTGEGDFSPIVPSTEHRAVFFGLARVAGDTTQREVTDTFGTYTENAKSKIHDLLNAPVTVSGTTPTITAMSGVRYICGEVATLSITPSASGDCEIMFTSGSTPTVLTVPNTVKWMNGFDPTSLDADTVYDVIITDGTYGMVASWAV